MAFALELGAVELLHKVELHPLLLLAQVRVGDIWDMVFRIAAATPSAAPLLGSTEARSLVHRWQKRTAEMLRRPACGLSVTEPGQI